MADLVIYRTAERPSLKFWWVDDDGVTLIDFSTGYTFVLKLGAPGQAATFTKSTGITGAAGSGSEPSGTPNLVVSFTAAELDGLTKGPTTLQIRATTGGLDRVMEHKVTVKDVIT